LKEKKRVSPWKKHDFFSSLCFIIKPNCLKKTSIFAQKKLVVEVKFAATSTTTVTRSKNNSGKKTVARFVPKFPTITSLEGCSALKPESEI
jgi:hypothetical protein